MRVRRYLKFFLICFLSLASYLGLDRFCSTQTHDFRPYLILSNLPNDPRWEPPSLSSTEAEGVRLRLNQNFTFLGSGGWCYAFLGEDQKTVLKFYKHTHLTLQDIFHHFSFAKLLLQSPPWPTQQPYFQEMNFKSCLLLYTRMKQRTGLIHVHLNKTQGLYPPVTLIDAIGIRHTIDLDQTEFLIQERADLVIPHLDTLMQQGKVELAKQCVEEMILCLIEMAQKGIRDTDASFRNNFGYVDHHAIAIDCSSFTEDPLLLDNPTQILLEVRAKTQRLSHYLRKYQPLLYTHYTEMLAKASEPPANSLVKLIDFSQNVSPD